MLLNIPPHFICATALPCEIQMQEKQTIIVSKRGPPYMSVCSFSVAHIWTEGGFAIHWSRCPYRWKDCV